LAAVPMVTLSWLCWVKALLLLALLTLVVGALVALLTAVPGAGLSLAGGASLTLISLRDSACGAIRSPRRHFGRYRWLVVATADRVQGCAWGGNRIKHDELDAAAKCRVWQNAALASYRPSCGGIEQFLSMFSDERRAA
jgi:hypothetical protein